MSEIIIYRCQWTNNENVANTLTIQDLKNYDPNDVPTVQMVELTGGKDVMKYECYDVGSSDVLGYGIMGKLATFSFKTTAAHGMAIFSTGNDRRFLMKHEIEHPVWGTMIVFLGFVLMDGNSEPYVPPGQDAFIRATCGLGTLDGADLKNPDGTDLTNDIPLTKIQWLVRVLKPVGFDLRINIVDSLFNEVMNDRTAAAANSPWNQCWLLPSTYEKQVNEYFNCKEVLQALLNGTHRIYQYNGEWWVVRIAELKLGKIHYTQFLPDTAAVQGASLDHEGHKVDIGHARFETTYFIDRASWVEILRPAKSCEVSYKFELPKELPRNKDFIRGAIITPLLDDGVVEYEIDEWQPGRDSGDGLPTCESFIRRVFENGYEKERFIEFSRSTPAVPDNWRASKAIYVNKNDKFKFSIDRSLSLDPAGGGNYTDVVAKLKLYADDDTYYTMHGGTTTDPVVKWVQCTVAFNTNQKVISIQGNLGNDDLTEWKTKSVEAAPIPKTGKIFIQLYQSALGGSLAKTWLMNLQFDLIPFENGSYKKYNGEKITNTQNDGVYSLRKQHQLNHCESSHVIYQGALLRYDSFLENSFVLSNKWKDWSLQHAGAPYSDLYKEFDKFLKHASLDFYNQYRVSRPALNFKIKKLIHPNGYCDVHHVYLNSVNSDHTKNKSSICTSMVQDWMKSELSGNMVPIDDSTDQYAAVETFTTEHKFLE